MQRSEPGHGTIVSYRECAIGDQLVEAEVEELGLVVEVRDDVVEGSAGVGCADAGEVRGFGGGEEDVLGPFAVGSVEGVV